MQKWQHFCRLPKIPIKRFPADPVASASSSTNTVGRILALIKGLATPKKKKLEKLLGTCQLSESEESFLNSYSEWLQMEAKANKICKILKGVFAVWHEAEQNVLSSPGGFLLRPQQPTFPFF